MDGYKFLLKSLLNTTLRYSTAYSIAAPTPEYFVCTSNNYSCENYYMQFHLQSLHKNIDHSPKGGEQKPKIPYYHVSSVNNVNFVIKRL